MPNLVRLGLGMPEILARVKVLMKDTQTQPFYNMMMMTFYDWKKNQECIHCIDNMYDFSIVSCELHAFLFRVIVEI